MKFMIANDGPMLSTVLKVFRLICPWLKAIIVKACEERAHALCYNSSLIIVHTSE
jgi:hypothetical protein